VLGYDLGTTATSFLFTTWLATHDWQHAVTESVDIPSS
jgi:ubiquinone biosynthesis protein Coq4